MWQLATASPLLQVMRQHLGSDVVLFSTQIAVKPPHSGEYVPWHQDGERCRTCWIPLDDVDEQNGTLSVRPSWHKRGRMKFKKVKTKQDVQRATFYMDVRIQRERNIPRNSRKRNSC
eukprot:m.129818 g.129818  ORF g.129818 m.129818 type:complete len:117 (-) comp19958_c0_seq10:41-391(-)